MLLSKSRLLPLLSTRSLAVSAHAARSTAVAKLDDVPDFMIKKMDGADANMLDSMADGYHQLPPEDKALLARVAGPWTDMSLADKQNLYDLRYDQSLWEEEDEREISGYFKNSFYIWLVTLLGCGFNAAQTIYGDIPNVGTPEYGRHKAPEWDEAQEYRYAKFNPDPISRNLGGFR